jgi:hypothetical protein
MRQKLRVLGVTEDTSFVVAGGRLAFYNLMDSLASVGNDVTVLSCTGATEDLVDTRRLNSIRLRVSPSRIVGPITFLAKLFLLLPKRLLTCDVLVVNSGYPLPEAVALAKVTGKKVVVLQHDAHNLETVEKFAASTSRKYMAIVRWMLMYPPLRLVDGILCVTDSTRRGVMSLGVTTRAFVIGNTIKE